MMRQRLRRGLAVCRPAAAWACGALVALFVGAGLPALAQTQTPTDVNAPPLRAGDFAGQPTVWDCGLDSAGIEPRVYGPNARSYYGLSLTPRDTLRILIICAGFKVDNRDRFLNPGIPQNNDDADNPWPQTDATHSVWGTALPRAVVDNSVFYHAYSQFSATSPDKNLSMEYYHASRHVPGQAPFQVIAEALPDRVNVDNEGELWDKIKQRYPGTTPDSTFDWSRFDRRTNGSGFLRDNSQSAPDGKLDFVIILWRNVRGGPRSGGGVQGIWRRNPANLYDLLAFPTSGLVAPAGSPFPSYRTGDTYTGGTTLFNGQAGFDRWTLAHEMQHCLIASMHYNNAHAVPGDHLHNAETYGLMNGKTNSCVHPWERWYMGWDPGTTGANALPSHIETAAQNAAAGGIYTLRDYSATGDAMRIRIPQTEQYLWLANHTSATPLSGRYDHIRHPQTGVLYPPTELGLLATVEDMHTDSTNDIISQYDQNRINGLRPVSSRGNFDYTPLGPLSMQLDTSQASYFGGSPSYNLHRGLPNPLGGQGDSQYFRWDKDMNDTITYTQCFQNDGSGNCNNEQTWIVNVDGRKGLYLMGYEDAFQQVGQKLGMMTNPGLIAHLRYNPAPPQPRTEAVNVHGLSVEIIGKNAAGDLTIRVRYDDVDVPGVSSNQDNLRWTGDIALHNNPDVVGADLNIPNQATLLLDESGTVNRHTHRPGTTKFVNLTKMTCYDGSLLNVAGGGKLLLQNQSTLVLKSGSVLHLQANAELRLESGSEVIVEDGAKLLVEPGAKVVVLQNAHLTIQNTDPAKGLILQAGSQLIAHQNGEIRVTPGARLDLTTPYVPGTGGGLLSGLVLNDHASHLLIDKSTLNVAKDVDFTFGGTGYITFKGPESTLELDPATSHWLQTGPARTNMLYELLDGAALRVEAASFDLSGGRLRYEGGSSLEVTTGKDVTLQDIDFSGNPQNYGGQALICTSPSFTATNCLTHHFTGGIVVTAANGATISGCYMYAISSVGWDFTERAPVGFSGGEVHDCNQHGILSKATDLYLQNGIKVYENRHGVYSETDSSRLIVGDQGCAWIINNTHAGVKGTNIHLDIDALLHQGTNPDLQINRFDGNTQGGGKIFDICYGAGQTPLPNVPAEGNYWGSSVPTYGSDYVLSFCSTSSMASKLDTDQAVTCAPTHCGGCGAIPRPAAPVAGTTPVASLALTLAPNPAQDRVSLTVEERGAYQYRIVTPQGQTVVTGAFVGGAAEVRTAGWPSGAYRVVLWNVDTKARASQTLVVE